MNHDHYGDDYLAGVLEDCKTIAVVGASTDDKKPSFWVTGFLLGKGYTVYPVNPRHVDEMLLGRPVLASLAEVPRPIDLVDVFRNPCAFPATVEDVLRLPHRPKAIWGQLGVRNDQAARRAEDAGIRVVMDRSLVTEYALVYSRTHARGEQVRRQPERELLGG